MTRIILMRMMTSNNLDVVKNELNIILGMFKTQRITVDINIVLRLNDLIKYVEKIDANDK